MIETKNSRERRRSVIRDFSLNTSIQGISSIAKSERWPNRIFWSVITFAFVGITIFFIVQSFRDFFSYPTQTTVKLDVQRSQPFPAFSICNISPMRYDLFINAFLNYTNSLNITNTNDTSTISSYQSFFIRDFLREGWNSGRPMSRYLYSLESMLLSCKYNNIPCNTSDFAPFFSAQHGACFTFNARSKQKNNLVLESTDGYGSGNLLLELYVHNHQYVPFIANSDAAIVGMLHDNSELPLIDVAGIQFGGGKHHKVSYKRRTYELLEPPYSTCTENIPPEMNAMFELYQGTSYRYSQVLCYQLCTQRYIYETCGCVDPFKWTTRYVYVANSNQVIAAELCREVNTCYAEAQSRIQADQNLWNKYCSSCNEACSSTDFTITTSSSKSPPTERFFPLKSRIDSLGVPVPKNWSADWKDYIERNFVSIQVVLESTRVEVFEQQKSISPIDLISNIGGHTGLWIGISFLSLLEIIEIFYSLIYREVKEISRRISASKTIPTSQMQTTL